MEKIGENIEELVMGDQVLREEGSEGMGIKQLCNVGELMEEAEHRVERLVREGSKGREGIGRGRR